MAIAGGSAASPASFPEFPALPEIPGLADPLTALDGKKIRTREEWFGKRRPELKALFAHWMYGQPPLPPGNTTGREVCVDVRAFEGRATMREVELTFGPAGTPKIMLLLVTPNRAPRPAPVLLGLSFAGNDKEVLAPVGTRKNTWSVGAALDRGFAVASFHAADVDPDKDDFTNGVHPFFAPPGRKPGERGPHEWGTIMAWAWGLSRAVDWLVEQPGLDPGRIATLGHSRMGKAALLAAAFDERIAMAIASQAGCGGSAPSRGTLGESIKDINTNFPHWFCTAFRQFNDHPKKLPVDQHLLVALCAPRPVLFCDAEDDQWANPAGQFEVLKAAEPVYRWLGAGGLKSTGMPKPGVLSVGAMGYFIRPGIHAMTPVDWDAYLDFADHHFSQEDDT